MLKSKTPKLKNVTLLRGPKGEAIFKTAKMPKNIKDSRKMPKETKHVSKLPKDAVKITKMPKGVLR